MINEQWKLDTIEKMAKAIYELSPYENKGYLKTWDGLCDIAKRQSNGYNYIAIRYKGESLEKAETAFNTMIAELPEEPMNLKDKTIEVGAADFNSECALIYQQLIALGDKDNEI